jgi:multisubunit Na+/H+ antiporter MnhF subunit
VIPDSNATLIVRSSPRVVAPDWRNRIRQTPVVVWIAVTFLIVLIVLRGPAALPGIWIALVLVGLVGGAVVGAKALTARARNALSPLATRTFRLRPLKSRFHAHKNDTWSVQGRSEYRPLTRANQLQLLARRSSIWDLRRSERPANQDHARPTNIR